MKKTYKMTLVYFLFITTCILGIVAVIAQVSMIFYSLIAVIDIILVFEIIKLSHCPYCGKLGIPVKPFLKQMPCCKKCGKVFNSDKDN